MDMSLQDLEGHSDTAFQRNSNTAWRTIAGETIVVHLFAKEFYGLNESGADVWNALDGTTDLGCLSARFGIAPVDLAGFVVELAELDLVDVVEENEESTESGQESETPLSGAGRKEGVDPPRIVWREEIRQVAASCAFHPATNPLCNQAPFS